MKRLFVGLTLALCMTQGLSANAVGGVGVKAVKLLNAVTTTGAGTGAGVQNYSQIRTFVATVAGSGAVTATVLVQCSMDNTYWVTLGTITLSGTTSDTAAFSSNSSCAYHRGNVTAVTGTSAAVTLWQGGG